MKVLSRISVRLLAFNVLLVFLPAAGLLYLDTYERELLKAQEQAMVQQGRLLASALSLRETIDPDAAKRILRHLHQRHQARLRVLDEAGELLADSSRIGPRAEPEGSAESTSPSVRQTWLYRLGSLPVRLYRGIAQRGGSDMESGDFYSGARQLLGSEVIAALAGRYGATTRLSGGQRSVTLYVAIPIRSRGKVIGAALVSQSTFAILQALDAVRVDVFTVVLASVMVAAVLSLLLSMTIARPLRRLRDEAAALIDRRGRLRAAFRASRGRDEIGDLSRALAELTRRLQDHMAFVETFASDVSHEFKNPLATIRSATEVLSDVDNPEERRRFLHLVQREVARMEGLLAGVREITRIDAQLEQEERRPVDLAELLGGIVEGYRQRSNHGVTFELSCPEQPVWIRASADRMTQVFDNLLDNAVGFSPAGGTVRVALALAGGTVSATVEDSGPGVPAEHRERVFDRFFSYRPSSAERDGHTGLGLAIAKAIVEGYGGAIRAGNNEAGGARLEVELPRREKGMSPISQYRV